MVASRNCVPLPKLPSGATLNLESPGWGANSREWGGKLSTGGRVWPGAAAMCQLLLTLQPDVKNSHVLELGCGTGAAGLFAAALGAQRVLLTDGQAPETQLAALNARRHAELLAAGARVWSVSASTKRRQRSGRGGRPKRRPMPLCTIRRVDTVALAASLWTARVRSTSTARTISGTMAAPTM